MPSRSSRSRGLAIAAGPEPVPTTEPIPQPSHPRTRGGPRIMKAPPDLSPGPIPYGTWGSKLLPRLADVRPCRGEHRPVRRRVDGTDPLPAQGPAGPARLPGDRLDDPLALEVLGSPLVASCAGRRVPGYHLEDACATGLQATLAAAAQIQSGDSSVVGVLTFDRTSDSPVGVFPERRSYQRTVPLADVWDNFGFDRPPARR